MERSSSVFLVRHCEPEILPDVSSARWRLSSKGIEQARCLRDLLPSSLARVVASDEVKALETAKIIAEVSGSPVEVTLDLREQGGSVGWLERAEFEARVKAAFERMSDEVLGGESMDHAATRLAGVVGSASAGDVLVTHGRIISALVGRTSDVDPFTFWTDLAMPAVVEVDGGGRMLRTASLSE